MLYFALLMFIVNHGIIRSIYVLLDTLYLCAHLKKKLILTNGHVFRRNIFITYIPKNKICFLL